MKIFTGLLVHPCVDIYHILMIKCYNKKKSKFRLFIIVTFKINVNSLQMD